MSADISHANELLAALQANFVGELDERIGQLESHTLAYEQGKFKEVDFDALFRAVHSLKGTAGTFGLAIISAVCHAYEDYLNSEHPHNAKFLSSCLDYVDLLRSTAEGIHQGRNEFSHVEAIIRTLRERHFAKPFTALLVEPSKVNAHLCQSALASLPVQIVQIEDGLQALTRLLSEPFDLLITSREIKTLNGLALIAALKLANRPGKPVRSILLTSQTNKIQSPMQPDHTVLKDRNMEKSLARAVSSALGLTT